MTVPVSTDVTQPAAPSDAVERLAASTDIAAVLSAGRRGPGRLTVVHARFTGEGRTRVAVIASRKVGTAVVRNRAKRLLREAIRLVKWRQGFDVVVVARADCAAAPLRAVHAELLESATRLDLVASPDTRTSGA